MSLSATPICLPDENVCFYYVTESNGDRYTSPILDWVNPLEIDGEALLSGFAEFCTWKGHPNSFRDTEEYVREYQLILDKAFQEFNRLEIDDDTIGTHLITLLGSNQRQGIFREFERLTQISFNG